MQNSSTGEELGNAAKSATSDPAAEKNLFRFSVPGSQIPKTINNPSFPNLSSPLFPSSLPAPSTFSAVTSPFGINTPTSTKPLDIFQSQPFIQNPTSTSAARPGIQKSGLPSSRDQVPPVFGSQYFRSSILDITKQVSTNPVLSVGESQKMQQVSVDDLPTSSQEKLLPLQQQTEATSSKQNIVKSSALAADISQLRAIVVYKIPEDSNNKLELTKHFQRFGNVIRIITNTKKGNAAIYYDSHVSFLFLFLGLALNFIFKMHIKYKALFAFSCGIFILKYISIIYYLKDVYLSKFTQNTITLFK